jgi:hypothetical protein
VSTLYLCPQKCASAALEWKGPNDVPQGIGTQSEQVIAVSRGSQVKCSSSDRIVGGSPVAERRASEVTCDAR